MAEKTPGQIIFEMLVADATVEVTQEELQSMWTDLSAKSKQQSENIAATIRNPLLELIGELKFALSRANGSGIGYRELNELTAKCDAELATLIGR